MKLFFDNCVSTKFVEALRILAQIQEYELIPLRERFPADTRDEDWIRALASDGQWVIISGDPRISKGQAQRRAWQESGLTAFFFAEGWASRGFWKQAESLIHWWPQIVLKAREAAPPSDEALEEGEPAHRPERHAVGESSFRVADPAARGLGPRGSSLPGLEPLFDVRVL